MKSLSLASLFFLITIVVQAQMNWQLVDSVNATLPKNVELYGSSNPIDGKPNRSFYLKVKLKDKDLQFDVDTSLGRRLTPSEYYRRNNNPLLVVNGSFFNFDKSQNLNVVIKNKRVVAHNLKSVQRKIDGKSQKIDVYRSAIGINKKRMADVAWITTDSSSTKAYGTQQMDSIFNPVIGKRFETSRRDKKLWLRKNGFKQWKMSTAIGGGPVLVQEGKIKIYNEQEKMFDGKDGLTEKHPRTAMGYTADGYLIILVIEGRNPGIAEGASLLQEAKIFIELGCMEALNLDGGGSSCMLVNGKETIKPSDKGLQRPVPAVFMIKSK